MNTYNATILDRLVASTSARVEQHKARHSLTEVAAHAREIARAELERTGRFTYPFECALAKPGLRFICEVKKASPSKGIIAPEFPYLDIAREYEAAGADAISCLTEPDYFKGSDVYLSEIAHAVDIPVLRKDFIIDAYMIYEAKVLGASAVLLICAILSDEQLTSYLALAHDLGMSALVETRTEHEITRALTCGASIVGVNNRNLATFDVDLSATKKLRSYVGTQAPFVSESGIHTHEDVEYLASLDVDAVLVGEALMCNSNKTSALRALRGDLS